MGILINDLEAVSDSKAYKKLPGIESNKERR